MHSWNHTSQPHSVEIEHRLTVVEQQASTHRRTTAQHGRRITALETKQPNAPRWTPRDYMLTAAGVIMVLAALAEKVGWSTAVAGFVRLYGLE